MSKVQTYYIYNKTDDERYYKTFNTYKDCFWWVFDNLDVNKKWETSIKRNTMYSKINAKAIQYYTRKLNKRLDTWFVYVGNKTKRSK